MHTKHLCTPSRALYNVFILPSLLQKPPVLNLPKHQIHPRPAQQPRRSFTATPVPYAKTRAPEVRTEKWNEEITSREIYLIDPNNPGLPSRTTSRYEILRDLDKTTHRLVQVGSAPRAVDAFTDAFKDEGAEAEEIPVCKIISKKQAYEDERRRKNAAKEKKKVSNIVSSVKTLELNWAIDANDLGHRLEKMKGFLEEGRKVEVVLAAKKRGRKATQQECEGVVKRIRGVVEEVKGAREEGQMQGGLGKFSTMGFVGRPISIKKEQSQQQQQQQQQEEAAG